MYFTADRRRRLVTKKFSTYLFQSNIFIVNLAFSDMMMMTTQSLPVALNAFASDKWMYGPLMCKVYACVGGIFGKF